MALTKPFALVLSLYLAGVSAGWGATNCGSVWDAVASKTDVLVKRFSPGAKTYDAADLFARELIAMNEDDRSSWISAIGEAYRKVPKKDPNPLAAWAIGGRRLMDRALTLVERRDEKFAAFPEGTDVSAPLRAELRADTRRFRADYDENDVLAILGGLKEFAKVMMAKSPGGPPLRIVVGGSIVNGRGRLSESDLDIAISRPELTAEMDGLAQKINVLLGAPSRTSHLTVEPHAVGPEFYGKNNPFVFEVTADEIALLVYPAGTNLGHDLRAATPRRFVIRPEAVP